MCFNVTISTFVSVILLRVVRRMEETCTYSWSKFCTVNREQMPDKYQLFHFRLNCDLNSDLRGGRRVYYQYRTIVPPISDSGCKCNVKVFRSYFAEVNEIYLVYIKFMCIYFKMLSLLYDLWCYT